MINKIKWMSAILCVVAPALVFAQYQSHIFLRNTIDSNQELSRQRIISNVIIGGLSRPLNEDTGDDWQNALSSAETIHYFNSFIQDRIGYAMHDLVAYPVTFQRSVLEAAFTGFPDVFTDDVKTVLKATDDPEIFAISSVYLMNVSRGFDDTILSQMKQTFGHTALSNQILARLYDMIRPGGSSPPDIADVLKVVMSRQFLPNEVVLFSFQRRNRDYPGLAIVRKKDGSFEYADNGELFHVPQLARGISNLPYFLKRGNTPQGIYRMYGFGISSNRAIGPTTNLQMGMPVELSYNRFFSKSSSPMHGWTPADYSAFLPGALRNYTPMYESFYAGLAGRREIIAHGSTVNPEYYKEMPFYPLTPTDGCLSTAELWNGKLVSSDQQKLIDAIMLAGGATGYVVVLDIDDRQAPVTLADIQTYISQE